MMYDFLHDFSHGFLKVKSKSASRTNQYEAFIQREQKKEDDNTPTILKRDKNVSGTVLGEPTHSMVNNHDDLDPYIIAVLTQL